MNERTSATAARCGTLFLVLLLSFAQANAQTPQSAQEWMERFEGLGVLSGLGGVITPCTDGDPLGPATLDLLLARPSDDPMVRDLATVLRVPWEDCPDPRVDRWLANALLLALTREEGGYVAAEVWDAIRHRSAPPEYQPWRQLALDPEMPMDAREGAMYQLRGGMSASEHVEMFVELLQSPVPPVTFLAVETRDLLRSHPAVFVAALDAEKLTPPDRRWLFRPGG
jgi:hypothetical protein